MVSIITVNYNGFKDTVAFIASLKHYETYPFEVIVVDNASPNGDIKRLLETYKSDSQVAIVSSKENLGFAGGNRLGNTKAKGEYRLYMNNDMLIERPFLEALVQRLLSSPKIGAVSPKIRFSYAPQRIQYAGYRPMKPIVLRNSMIGAGEEDKGQYNVATPTAFLHGACMMISAKVEQEVGEITPVYFLFYEELDWSNQIKRKGYELWYEPLGEVYHKEGQTIAVNTPQRNYFLTRSRVFFARRNYRFDLKLMSCLYLLTVPLMKDVLKYLFKRQWKMIQTTIKGTWDGLIVDCRKEV
jgi:GT2 family glycosyltransferase